LHEVLQVAEERRDRANAEAAALLSASQSEAWTFKSVEAATTCKAAANTEMQGYVLEETHGLLETN